jgi:predicted secreted protein
MEAHMAKTAGRLCVIKKNAVTIGGGRNVSITVNGSPINVEDQGDDGFQTLLSGVITGRSIELSIDGYEEDQVIRDIAMASTATGQFMDDLTFEFPNGDEISGDFFLASYSETGAYEDGQTFTATFTSDGTWTYTPTA